MLAAFKNFKQADDVGVLDLLEQINLLEDFSLTKFVFHVTLFDGLDGHLLSSKLMHTKGYLAECTFSY
jgi:hypothetical protein